MSTERIKMSRCPSCNRVMDEFEMSRKITLEDGTEIPEEFCTSCTDKYVYNADELDTKTYAFEHLTEVLYEKFTKFEE